MTILLLLLLALPQSFAQNRSHTSGMLKVMPASVLQNDQRILAAHPAFLECNGQTPEINLEKATPFPGANFKGPFYGLPHDDQRSLGTCYANTAKNLLVGVSSGEAIASYLDLAILSKQANGTILNSGIESGYSCGALSAAVEEGFCPQQFSPLEQGSSPNVQDLLFADKTYKSLSDSLLSLRNFSVGMANFQRFGNKESQLHLKDLKTIFKQLVSDPELVMPLPVARIELPADSWINQIYYRQKNRGVKVNEFLQSYKNQYQSFYPTLVQALLDGKDLNQVVDLWESQMSSTITQFGMGNDLAMIRRLYIAAAEKDFNRPNFRLSLRKSLDYLKVLTKRQGSSDQNFLIYCATDFNSGMEALKFISPLVEKIKQASASSDILFTTTGELKSTAELMQLTVAPACTQNNREKLDFDFYCNDGYSIDTIIQLKRSGLPRQEQIRKVRARVVAGLLQGVPSGNSYMTSSISGHINTIVGFRFNPSQAKCEYLIRDSIGAHSFWRSEEEIFQKLDSLIEVRRK